METSGPISAAITSIVVYMVGAALIYVKPLRDLLAKYGPQPGEGPSPEAQKNGESFLATVTSQPALSYPASIVHCDTCAVRNTRAKSC